MEDFDYSGQTTDELLALEHEVWVFGLCFAFEHAVEQKFKLAVGREHWERPAFEIYLAQFSDVAAGRPLKGLWTEEELTVLAIMSLDRQVRNGGHHQMFVNRLEFTPILVQACERIGRPDVAAVAQRAVDILGYDPNVLWGRPYFEELEDRIRDQECALYDECDDRFYAIAEDLVEVSLWSFIKANRDKITVPWRGEPRLTVSIAAETSPIQPPSAWPRTGEHASSARPSNDTRVRHGPWMDRMRTVVRFQFNCGNLFGGASTILEPAGCGPDVAVVEDIPELGWICVAVMLAEDDQRIPVLIDFLQWYNLSWSETHEDRYTDDELDNARLLLMEPNGQCTFHGGIGSGTTYERSDGCAACGTPARQTSPLLIDGDDVGELDGHRAGSTMHGLPVVDDRLAQELENNGATGLDLRRVYAMEHDQQTKLPWKQLCAKRSLPPMSPRTTGLVRDRECKVCMRDGYARTSDAPTRIVYRASDLAGADDVNMTWEHYSRAFETPDRYEAHLSYAWLLVTPKVMRILRAAGVTEFDWIPIRVVEDG